MLNKLKPDILRMIDLSYKLGELSESRKFKSNIYDKVNYDEELVNRILVKSREYNEELNKLKTKWLENYG